MPSSSKTTVATLKAMKQRGEKITMLTAYDASFAKAIDQAGIETILVGDSLGMVIQGHETTVPVTVDDIIYHGQAVARAISNALLILDLPFMSYTSPEMALHNTMRLMQEGAGHMVKLEGGAPQVETVRQLSHHGVPVCAHLGLQPQSIHKLGSYRVQGRSDDARQRILDDAKLLQDAGADLLVLECVPIGLANDITELLDIPTIGIGAGNGCDGQVLVMHDLLGLTPHAPKFTKNFMADAASIPQAFADYREQVKSGAFPEKQHSFI